MVALKLDLVLLLNIFYVSECARRIKDGQPVTSEKRYTVYLVKAPKSDKIYDAWVCGGALVSTLFIVTSAACVDDVEFMYAIAGYKKYVKDSDIDTDVCTSTMKKKIVYTCIPLSFRQAISLQLKYEVKLGTHLAALNSIKFSEYVGRRLVPAYSLDTVSDTLHATLLKYELEYDKIEKWSFIDIALVKVESPYDFTDQEYLKKCSYLPTSIPINYEERFQEPGTDGLVLGWGHTEKWRKPDDNMNYNQEFLRYAPIKILDKEKCKQRYDVFPNMGSVIDKYMICTLEKGDFDDSGQMVGPPPKPMLNGCQTGLRLVGDDGEPCDDDRTRRDVLRTSQGSNDSNIAEVGRTKNRTNFYEINGTRKSGICQNDHGGPLVTWIGAKEVLIGVASVFIVSDDSKCMGPYLYTSTQCNGAFLDCILSNSDLPDKKKRRAICDSPPIQRGYDTVERYISWKNHPAGAAENEALARERNLFDKFDNNIKKAGVSKALEEYIQLGLFSGNETILIRPQMPLDQ